MARRSSHEDTIKNWFPKETVVLNSRKLLESKQEIDVYFPRYRLGVEINGAMWHSEASGKTKYFHQEKYKRANRANITLITFYDWEITKKPELVKSFIQREMLKSFNLQYDMTKRYVPEESELNTFLSEHIFYGVNGGTKCLCRSDKKGFCSALGLIEKDTHVRADFYIERKGLHVLNGIVRESNFVRENSNKPLVITLGADHGSIYPKSLVEGGYKLIELSDPTFYYLQGNNVLSATTKEDTEGYTRVFDAGKLMFCHKDDYEYVNTLQTF